MINRRHFGGVAIRTSLSNATTGQRNGGRGYNTSAQHGPDVTIFTGGHATNPSTEGLRVLNTDLPSKNGITPIRPQPASERDGPPRLPDLVSSMSPPPTTDLRRSRTHINEPKFNMNPLAKDKRPPAPEAQRAM